MKYDVRQFNVSMKIPLLVIVTACAASLSNDVTFAQSTNSHLGSPPDITQSQPPPAAVSLGLKKDEALRVFDVTVPNNSGLPINVYGVQTTAGLYVVDFPTVIPPKKEGKFTLLYAARPGVGGTADLLRVLTDRAETVVQINHDREQTVQLSASTLQWVQGESPATKEVTLNMLSTAKGTPVPTNVRALGDGNRAELRKASNGTYTIAVTPGSTAKARQFPIFVDFDSAVPGVATVIFCSVVPAN